MAQKKKEEAIKENKYPRIIMGLDVSTVCIGVSIIADFGNCETPEIMKITHISPKVSSKIKGIEALLLRKNIFENDFLTTLKDFGITDVVIEEPLLSSNNVNTVATLLRFNGMISETIYRIIGVVPSFISSYDARMYSFPELVAIRKYNKKGEEYPLKHVNDAIKKDNIVLFGAYPFDVDKKTVMMNMVNELYKDNGISWVLDKNGELKKENYDACDSLICALAYININHYGIEKPTIAEYKKEETINEVIITYTTKIWNRTYNKTLRLNK
jgi:hypothetical protein